MALKSKTYAELLKDIAETFRKWGRDAPTIENDLPTRSRAKRYQSLQEREVRVHFTIYQNGLRDVGLIVRREDTATENLHLVATGLEMMRLAEVRGVGDLLVGLYRQIYPAPQPTPPPAQEPPRIPPHYAALHLAPNAPLEIAEAAYRALVKQHHPDVGGNTLRMQQINAAIERIRKETIAPHDG